MTSRFDGNDDRRAINEKFYEQLMVGLLITFVAPKGLSPWKCHREDVRLSSGGIEHEK
jgi:hypothetical protein